MRLHLVIPWFGNANGGAEVYAGGLARALGRAGHDVHVLATCCPDPFHDWGQDGLEPGTTQFAPGVTLHRFPVRPRDGGRFANLYGKMDTTGRLTKEEAETFFAESISSLQMEEWLGRHGFDGPNLFMPYLYGTTIFGARRVPRSHCVLIPCLHNEAAAYTEPVAALFQRAGAVLFLSDGERDLARALYGLANTTQSVIGGGIDLDAPADGERFRTVHQLGDRPYLLAVGRKVPLKGQQLLVDLFLKWLHRSQGHGAGFVTPRLVLVGSGELHIPPDQTEHVINISGATDQDVQDATAGCSAFIHPSFVESFSLVMMQAWAHRRPVLVNGECEVTLQHVRRSGGGLAYSSAAQFSEALDRILQNDALARDMGRDGRAYVEARCNWDEVARRVGSTLENLNGDGTPVWLRA